MRVAVSHVIDDARAHELLAAAWLSADELARYRRFLVDSGRRDFLTGRIAAKSALDGLHATGNPGRAWEIVPGAWSHPRVRGPACGLAVTLAHAAGFGVAVAHDDRWTCGIDIEALTHTSIETIATQVSPEEAAWARSPEADADAAESARWLALWTAREAFGKLLGTGLGLPEALLPTANWQPLGEGWTAELKGNASFAVQTARGATTVASLVMPAGSFATAAAEALQAWIVEALRE